MLTRFLVSGAAAARPARPSVDRRHPGRCGKARRFSMLASTVRQAPGAPRQNEAMAPGGPSKAVWHAL